MRIEKPRGTLRWHVTASDAGVRIDAWLAARPEVGSRSRAREWIERGKIFLNSAEVSFDRAGERLRAGDEIVIWEDRPGSRRPRSRDLVTRRGALRVVFEDQYLLVADKPPGLLVEPLPGPSTSLGAPERIRRGEATEITLQHLVADHTSGREALVVHRTDRDTSGLVVFAKDDRTQQALKRQFERRTAERTYVAVLEGRPAPAEGTWQDMLVWDKTRLVQRRARPEDTTAKEAVASYKVTEQFRDAALVEIRLVTGKRNQIRVQAALRHHPVAGEKIYRMKRDVRGSASALRASAGKAAPRIDFPRQALHAARLAFRHPATGARVEFTAPLPDDLRTLLKQLKRLG